MSDFSGVSSSGIKSLQYAPSAPETKGLVQPGAGTTTQDPALVQWFEQANAYYSAVMAGDPDTPKPSEMEWNDFMSQLQWAQTTLYGGGGMGMGGPLGPMAGGYGAPQGPQSNQFGGMSGTMDNWVYTEATAKIGFTGNGTHDIWSNDVTIDVAPVSGHVTVEQTNDTRSTPAESVVKITVTDPATGTEAVYFVHDFDPAKDTIKINTPEESQLTNNAAFADGVIEWGEFKAGGATDASAKPDASIEGEEISENNFRYEPEFAGETVNFWANPNEPGVTQTNTIFADANISVKPSDEVNVTGPDASGVVTVTVTHSKGTDQESTDVYNVQKGYNVNINQKIEYISENGTAIGEDGIDADALKERVTINGATEDTATEGGVDADAIVTSMMEGSDRTEGQLLSALDAAGYNYDSIEDLKAAITAEEFPPKLEDLNADEMKKLWEFFKVLDGDLKESIDEIYAVDDETKQQKSIKDANERFVELLQSIYPNSIVSVETPSSAWQGSFSINGEDFTWEQTTADNMNMTMD